MKTVTILVCDDDSTLREILQRKIEKLCVESGVPCRIIGCASGEDVLKLLKTEPEAECGSEPTPDILFLDIQMPDRNGMEVAEELRKRQKETILIFVTALSEYVYEAFDVGAFHYLVKPFGDDKLQEVLKRALQQCARQQEIRALQQAGAAKEDRCVRTEGTCGETQQSGRGQSSTPEAILVKRGGVSTKVLLEDIIYAEVFNRKVMLHTIGGDLEYYGKLTDLSEQTGPDFYRTHRAYLVNFKYVEKYNAATIWLERGTALVSKKQYTGFVRHYMQYISRKKDG